MPVTLLNANMVVQWAMTRTNGVFAPTRQGVDGIEYNLADLNAIFQSVYVESKAIVGSGTYTIDLTSLANLVNESILFTKLLFLFVLPIGSGVNIAPGASNGLQLFGGSGRSIDVPANGCEFWGGDPAGTGLTVDATHKTLLFTNTSGAALTLELVLAGAG